MKLFNKAAAFVLAACLSLQSVSVYAQAVAKTTEIPTLTVEEAAKKAIKNNTSIKNAEEDETFFEERHDEAVDALRAATSDQGVVNAMASLLSTELSQSLSVKNIAAQKENVEYSISKYFNNILGYEKDVELFDQKLAISEKELAIKKLKLELGMISQYDYDIAVLDMENTRNSRQTKVNAIDKAYRALNEAMGVSLDQKYKLVLELKYELVGDINIERHADNYVLNSLTIKTLENTVKTYQFKVDNFVVKHDAQTGIITETSSDTYEYAVYQLNQQLRKLSDSKVSMKKSVIDSYQSLKDTEISIKSTEIEIQKLYSQLTVLEKQLELGQTTTLTVDNMKYNISNAEAGLEKTKAGYALALMALLNPNLSASM